MIGNSRLAEWRECPRREHLHYDLGLEPVEKSEALRFGSAFHAARAGLDFDCDPFLRAKLEAVLTHYRDPFEEVVAREVPFEIPLRNPDTGAASTKETVGGIIDAIVRYRGRLFIGEFKTTGDLDGYFERLDLDTQPLTYWEGARALGYDVQGVVYVVVKRPGQRPYKATPLDKRKFKKDGTLYAKQRALDETPDEFRARVAESIDPETDIQVREVGVLHDAIERHQRDVWAQHQTRLFVRRSGLAPWRNPSACESCDLVSICGRDDLATVTPDGFRRVDPFARYGPRDAEAASA